MIVTTAALVPDGFDAITVWPFVFVRPECRKDAALIAHEMTHYARQPRGLVVLWWLAYLVLPKFRLAEEVLAFRAQMREGGITLDEAARRLSTKYATGVSIEEAKRQLAA